MSRLQDFYKEKVVADLTTKYSYKSPMEVPRLLKITLNMGLSEAVADKKVIEHAVGDLTKIAGQKPVVTKARKAIAGFKIREGYPIGCMVTLRGAAMYEFLDRLITVALPRVRDFRGVSGRAFDGRGNYNIGVKEQIIFPEIEYDKIDALRGMNISITPCIGPGFQLAEGALNGPPSTMRASIRSRGSSSAAGRSGNGPSTRSARPSIHQLIEHSGVAGK